MEQHGHGTVSTVVVMVTVVGSSSTYTWQHYHVNMAAVAAICAAYSTPSRATILVLRALVFEYVRVYIHAGNSSAHSAVVYSALAHY